MRFILLETIQLLLYKEKPTLLNKVNFDDDNIFLEPLLFAYFNSKKDPRSRANPFAWFYPARIPSRGSTI